MISGVTIFLSHSVKDEKLLSLVRKALEGTEATLEIAEEDFVPRRTISTKVREMIDSCDYFLVLLTPNSQRSVFVSHEVGYAFAKGKTVITLAAGGVHPKGLLSDMEYIRIDPSKPSKARRLVRNGVTRVVDEDAGRRSLDSRYRANVELVETMRTCRQEFKVVETRKRQTLRRILVDLVRQDVPVLLIDSYGIFNPLANSPKKTGRTKMQPGRTDYLADKVDVFRCGNTLKLAGSPVRISFSHLEESEVLQLTNLGDIKLYRLMLETAILRWRKDNTGNVFAGEYTVKNIINTLRESQGEEAALLVAELEYLDDVGIFKKNGTMLKHFLTNGRVTLLTMDGTPPDLAELVVRHMIERIVPNVISGEVHPPMLIISEASHFCGNSSDAACRNAIRFIAAEGWKFGVGLILVTRRPAELDNEFLSRNRGHTIISVV